MSGDGAVPATRTAAGYYKGNPLYGGNMIRTMGIGFRLSTAQGLRFQNTSPDVALVGARVVPIRSLVVPSSASGTHRYHSIRGYRCSGYSGRKSLRPNQRIASEKEFVFENEVSGEHPIEIDGVVKLNETVPVIVEPTALVDAVYLL